MATILSNEEFENEITGFELSDNGVIEDGTLFVIKLADGRGIPWLGVDGQGNALANGGYLIQLESVDSLGVVTAVIKSVTILKSGAQMTVRVYNEAGELIWEELTTDGVVPEMGRVSLSSELLDPGPNAAASAAEVRILLGDTHEVVWTGRDLNGSIVANGEYIIEVRVLAEGEEIVVTRTVTVLHGELTVLTGINAWPNPVIGEDSMRISTRGGDTIALRVKIYNLAGELLRTLNAPGDSVEWDLHAGARTQVADGVYIALVEALDASGVRDTRTVRIVVLR